MKKKKNLASLKKKVASHLKQDIKSFKREAAEDKELMKSLKTKKSAHSKAKKKDPKPKRSIRSKKGKDKVEKVMREYKEGTLHSGSKKGPVVKSRGQAIAIALSEARKKKTK